MHPILPTQRKVLRILIFLRCQIQMVRMEVIFKSPITKCTSGGHGGFGFLSASSPGGWGSAWVAEQCEAPPGTAPKVPTYLQFSSRRKMLGSLLFPTADAFLNVFGICSFSPHWQPSPTLISRSPRSFGNQNALKQTPCITSGHLKPFPRHRLWASLSGPSLGECGLTAGDHGQLSPQSRGFEGSESVSLFFSAHHLARSLLSFHVWHTFPCLAKPLASPWGRRGD